MSSQNTKPRGNSRVMRPAYYEHALEPEFYDPYYDGPGSLTITGGEASQEFDRKNAKLILFHDSLRDAAPDAWDASKAGDGSVLAWLKDGELHFAAEGGVIAPENSSWLFAHYVTCVEIRFNGCFDTSRVTDMRKMFKGCGSLTSLDISSFDTSRVKDMSEMFNDCESLTSLDVSGFDTSRVTSMWGMFCGCDSLRSLDVSHFDTSQVTYMHQMFFGCKALTELDVSHFDTSRVTDMDMMFALCDSLQALDLSNFDTSQVTGMNEMFKNCGSLKSLNPSGFDTSRVKDMSLMFDNCKMLSGLDASDFDTSQVKDMHGMFHGCGSLTSLDVSGFDTSQVKEMDGMFHGCSSLTSLDVSGFQIAGDAEVANLLYGCNALLRENIRGFAELPPGARASLPEPKPAAPNCAQNAASGNSTPQKEQNTKPRSESRVLESGYQSWCIEDEDSDSPMIVIDGYPLTELSVITGGERLGRFVSRFNCGVVEKSLTRWDVKRIEFHDCLRCAAPDAWDASGAGDGSVLAWRAGDELHFAAAGGVIAPEDCGKLFADYANCREIRFNGCFDTSRVTSMKGMFQGCMSLTALDLSGFDTSRVTNMENMFLACRSLTALDVSGFDVSRAAKLGGMFYDCERLQSLDLSGFALSRDADVRAMFRDCRALRPENIRGFAALPAQVRESLPAAGASDLPSKRDGREARRMDGESDGRRILMNGDGLWDIMDFNVPPIAGPTIKNTFYVVNRRTVLDRAAVRSITFHDTLSGVAPGCWDASEALDGSVLAWRDGYELHFAAEGGVIAPEDCGGLFAHYSSCEEIRFNGCFDTSRVTQMGGALNGMFKGCKSLASLDLSGFDTSRVTDMREMFDGCESLKSLDVSGFDTSRVADMSLMFYSCKSLASLDVSGFDTSRVESMGGMFADCASLTGLDVSGFNTSQVKNMNTMFSGCSSLTALDVSGFDTSRVTDMHGMFRNCLSLTAPDVSGFQIAENADARDMLTGCGVPWPDSRSSAPPEAQSNPSGADDGRGLPFKSADSRVMRPGGLAFDNTDVPPRPAGIAPRSEENGLFRITGKKYPRKFDRQRVLRVEFHRSLSGAPQDAWDASEARDGSVLAWPEKGVRELHIAAEGGVIAPENCEKLFMDFTRCEEIRFNGCFDTSRVTDMNHMFYHCRCLRSLDLTRLDTSRVTNMENMFAWCEQLESLNLSGLDTSQVKYMSLMFQNCFALRALDLSGLDTSQVKYTEAMFSRCYALRPKNIRGFAALPRGARASLPR